MKKLISEDQKNEIRQMHSLNESLFSDLLDNFKDLDIVKKISQAFGGSESKSSEVGKSLGSKLSAGNYKMTEPDSKDKKFYEDVLEGIGAPVTSENLTFFYAWRQAEGAKATYNPFNTTQKKENSTLWNCLKKKEGKCVAGVRNYNSEEDGIDATIKTLKNGHYKCIVDGLKNDIGAKKIAQCSDLKTWGTGEGISRVLNTGKINPPSISTTLVKKV